jgi:hypothetical protein
MFLTEMFRSSLLFEATDYRMMFEKLFRQAEPIIGVEKVDPLRKYTQDTIRIAKSRIAKSRLAKDDRIVWFLTHFRNGIRVGLLNAGLVGAVSSDERAEFEDNGTMMLYRKPEVVLGNIAHFLSLPIPAIANMSWKGHSVDSLNAEMTRLERQWQETVNDIITPEPDDTKLITFKDGFAWWLLDRYACDAEAAAMGHCGNRAAGKYGQQILSLRKHMGGDYWRPSATFILNSDGTLGEMKGRSNIKPAAKYHPYIVALLKHNIIQGIRGGGHAPGENFKISDLDADVREKLLAKKPQLVGLVTRAMSIKPRNEQAIVSAFQTWSI